MFDLLIPTDELATSAYKQLPATMTTTAHLHITDNKITVGETVIVFSHRHEVALIAVLIASGATHPESAIDLKTIERVLANNGQAQPLNRKQLSRLLDSVNVGLGLFALPSSHAKILNQPRKRTVGPWWWAPPPAFAFAIAGDGQLGLESVPVPPADAVLGSTTPEIDVQFALANDASLETTRKLLWQYFFADAHAWEGTFIEVADALDDEVLWRQATPIALIHRQLRLLRAAQVTRRFDEAQSHANQASKLSQQHSVLGAFFDASINQIRTRVLYSQYPVECRALVIDGANKQLGALFQRAKHTATTAPVSVNPHTAGRLYSLRSLALRRSIEALPSTTGTAEVNRLVTQCLADSIAAISCLLATLDLETTQNMIANTAYCVQKIVERNWLPGLAGDTSHDEVLDWYRLSFAWNNRFCLADNTVWEYIFLGEYWIAHALSQTTQRDQTPGATEQLEEALHVRILAHQTNCHGKHPSALDFYIHALARAQQLDDARQIAHCAVMLYRFAEIQNLPRQVSVARRVLQQVSQHDPDVIAILRSEQIGGDFPCF